jgi:hypothetical protein
LSSSHLFALADDVLAGSRGIRYDVARDGVSSSSAKRGDAGSPLDIMVVEHWLKGIKQHARAH